MEYLINGIRGFCMALADSVPGVSGGTIAFILGFYDKFINSLDSLMFGKKEEKEVLKGKYKNLIFTIIGIAIVATITYFNPMSGDGNIVDISNLNIGLALYIFVAAMIAISAMVLPGISGSTLLLIFGLYIPIMSAIKEFLHFNLSYLPVLIIFGLGILAGIALVIRDIKIALKKYRSQTIYCIIGLMIGSLYAIVMGATTLEIPQPPMNFETFSILFFAIGGAIILGLEKLKAILESKNTKG